MRQNANAGAYLALFFPIAFGGFAWTTFATALCFAARHTLRSEYLSFGEADAGLIPFRELDARRLKCVL